MGPRPQETPPGTGATMVTDVSRLVIDISAAEELDPDDLDVAVRRLRTELLDLDVRSVEFDASAPDAAGSKGGGIAALGVLLVQFATRSEVLGTIVAAIRGWLERGRSGTVRMTLDGDSIEISGRPTASQTQLIGLWMARHARAT